MSTESGCERTVLFDKHVALGARMAAFGGFMLPVQYAGIMKEHAAARTAVAVFDTCHMGEFRIGGPRVVEDLERLISCHVATLSVGQCRYGLLCNVAGGVIDDLLVYRLAETEFMLVVNAGTQGFDYRWVTNHLSSGTRCENLSVETAKLDIQGPASPPLVQRLVGIPLAGLGYYRFLQAAYRGHPVLVSRTGYTGEIGYEVYSDGDTARSLWDDCLAAGAQPAGLGARDTLRLEAGLPLYGHELHERRNAAESGFTRALASGKDYIGAAAVRDPALAPQRLVGLACGGRQAARQGDAILAADGATVGVVTSGSFAPTLGYAVALGYVAQAQAVPGAKLTVASARAALPATIVPLPFYTQGTVRADVRTFLSGQ